VFSFAIGMTSLMMSNAAAGQRIALDCRSGQGAAADEANLSGVFCAALAQHLATDLGLAVALGDAPGHVIAVTLNPRSARSVEVTITTAPLSGGRETTTASVLTSQDSKLTGFSARTLVGPIARQLGLKD
jgi:hypothetical protein